MLTGPSPPVSSLCCVLAVAGRDKAKGKGGSDREPSGKGGERGGKGDKGDRGGRKDEPRAAREAQGASPKAWGPGSTPPSKEPPKEPKAPTKAALDRIADGLFLALC